MLQDEIEPDPLALQASFSPAIEISNGVERNLQVKTFALTSDSSPDA